MLPKPYELSKEEYKTYKSITKMIKDAEQSKQNIAIPSFVSDEKSKEAYMYLDKYYANILEKASMDWDEDMSADGMYVHDRTKKVIFIDANEAVLRNIQAIPQDQQEKVKIYADTLKKELYNDEMITIALEDIFLTRDVCIK